jgi:hypothetical protein
LPQWWNNRGRCQDKSATPKKSTGSFVGRWQRSERKIEMWDFEEIFDSSSVTESLGVTNTKAATPLPFENWKWELQPAGNSTHDLERSAFAEQVAGPTVTPEFAFGPGSHELMEFRKIVPAPQLAAPLVGASSINTFLKSLVTKSEATAGIRDAPKHGSAIRRIVDKLKNSPVCKPLKNDPNAGEMWEALVSHATDYVTQMVHECATEV